MPVIGPAWLQWPEWIAAFLLAIPIILKAPGAVWRRFLVPLAGGITQVDKVSEAAPDLMALARLAQPLTELAELTPALKEMTQEFGPNGGKSTKDILTRLDHTTATHGKRLKALETGQKNIELHLTEAKKTAATRRATDGRKING